MATIHSRLYRAAMLATESTTFPLMVQAAAWSTGKPYSQELLHKCAADYEVLQRLTLEVDDGMDAVIAEQISTVGGGGAIDTAINGAVLRYTRPEPEPVDQRHA